MNYRSDLYKVLRRIFIRPYTGHGAAVKFPDSWRPQRDFSPVNPNKQELPKIDTRPEAVEERTKAARNSLLLPLAAIAGVVLIFAAAILLR